MLIDSITLRAIDRCHEHGIPFFAACLPGERRVAFAAHADGLEPMVNAPCFFIGKFNGRWSENAWIRGNLSAERACAIDFPKTKVEELPLASSTLKAQYLSSLTEVIARLKNRGAAKSVISLARRCRMPNMRVSDMFANLAEKSSGCFAYICFSPEYGCWMGAPPEVLVETDGKRFRTMALAGTIPSDAEEWDAKNEMEHQIVVDYIMQKLTAIGLYPEKGARTTLGYGSIKHLFTPICGNIGARSAEEIFDALNPTPALCGYPKVDALNDIAFAEEHDRECYGGCIGIKLPDASVHAFVNIRCCRIADGEMCCYGGGGITPDSSPEDEWIEANAKIDNFLLRLNS